MGKYKDEPRYNVISMRVSDVEMGELQHIASHHSLSISDVMRRVIDVYTRRLEPVDAGHRNV
jgi:hypothetical protein